MKKYLDNIIKWILYIYICVLPWLFITKDAYYSTDEQLLFGTYKRGVIDCFLYGKSVLTIITALILLVLLIVQLFITRRKIFDFNKMHDRIIAVCIIIYSVCTAASCILSKYKKIALWGGANSFEGTFVLLAYVVIFVAARFILINHADKARVKCEIENIVLIQAAVLSLFAIVENIFNPLYLTITGIGKNGIYDGMFTAAFYSSTYCAAFIILLFPLTLYVAMNSEVIVKKYVAGIMTAIQFLCIILTKSSAGMYILIGEFIVMLILEIRAVRNIKAFSKILLRLAAGMIVVFLVAICINGNILKNVSATASNETISIHKDRYFRLDSIEVDEDTVILKNEDSVLKCILLDGNVSFKDANDQPVAFEIKDGVAQLSMPYDMVRVGAGQDSIWIDLGYKSNLHFKIYNGSFYPMTSDGLVIRDISGNGVNDNVDHWFTGRGYIWRNTLPILKNTIIFGHGAGTYELYFKQFDYVGLLNSQGNTDLIIDRPHNWYLQMACNEGVIAMISIVVMIVSILYADMQYCKAKEKSVTIIAPSIVAVAGFAVMALLTDSCVTVSPLLWIILGMISCADKESV